MTSLKRFPDRSLHVRSRAEANSNMWSVGEGKKHGISERPKLRHETAADEHWQRSHMEQEDTNVETER
jgi:hypothetical protein